jgi:hypothetical protein
MIGINQQKFLKNYIVMDNNIFDIIDFVLKKKNIDVEKHSIKNFYIINRWLSMSDPSICFIINSITNRWILKNQNINLLKFYRTFLPKTVKNIKYIKKNNKNKDKENQDYQKIASNYELSIKEIESYEDMLDFLNKKNN